MTPGPQDENDHPSVLTPAAGSPTRWCTPLFRASGTSRAPHRRMVGLVLVEWLLAISMSLVLQAAGYPWMQAAWQSIQTHSVSQSLVRALRAAQQEAISRSTRVTVQPLACDNEPTTAADWSCPWRLYIDRDGDQWFDVDADQQLRTLSAPFPASITSTRDRVTFSPQGTTTQVQAFLINHTRTVSVSWARISASATP